MSSYRAFIDDAVDLARFQGQRYVVLRPFGEIIEEFDRVKNSIERRFGSLPISYVARPHLTLAGFPAGTELDSVRRLVGAWAPTVGALTIQIEGVSFFPFRIALLTVRRTRELGDALGLLRARALREGLPCFAAVAPEDWVFHLSVGYCSRLSAGEWEAVTECLGTMKASPVDCTVTQAEVVAFDNGSEYSGGVYPLFDGHSV